MKRFYKQFGKQISIIAISALLAVPMMGFTAPGNIDFIRYSQTAGDGEENPVPITASRDSDIILTGVNAPAAKYGANTTVGFVAKVKGNGYITSISPVISDSFPFETNDAAYMVVEGNTTTRELRANYNFTVRSDVETGYQAVAFQVEYNKDGVDYSLIKTVNVRFEGAPAPTEATEAPVTDVPQVSTPRIIVSGYDTDMEKVLAGENFVLTLHLQNTSTRTAVSNMKVSLESANGEFLPASGSSTQFISSLGAGKTVDITMEMEPLASLEPKPYVLTVTCSYEDGEANPFESVENISIPVYQEARIKITELMVMPDPIMVYNQGSVSFSVNNLGRGTLSNVQAKIEGDTVESEETFIGNIAPGSTGYADVMITGIEPTMDDGTVKLVITYEDSSGEELTYEEEISVFVMEEVYDNDFFMDDYPEEKSGMPLWQTLLIVLGILLAIIIAVVVIIVIVVKKKKRKAAEEAEALENEIDDDILSDINKETKE